MSKKRIKKDTGHVVRVSWRPLIIGVTVMLVVLAVFNAQLFVGLTAAYIVPRLVGTPTPIDVSNLSLDYYGKSRLVIPKINADTPVVYGMTSFSDSAVQAALENGILHFGDSTPPGAKGNTVYVGYSSAHPWAPGDYNFIFLHLHDLTRGDKLYVYKDGARYTYQVIDKKTVKPSDVSVLEASGGAMVTLVTNAPLGTNISRLVVRAELIDPAPVDDTRVRIGGAPELNDRLVENKLPGNGYDAIQALLARFN